MSTLKMTLVGLVPFLAAGLVSGNPRPASPNDDGRRVVEAWVHAVDGRNVAATDALLHPGYRSVFTIGEGGDPMIMDRKTYLEGITSGKIGGDTRTVEIHRVDVTGKFATVSATFTGAKATFTGMTSLVKTKSGWLITQDATVFTPKPAVTP